MSAGRVRVVVATPRGEEPGTGPVRWAVIVDVLRASTTLAVALGRGAARVRAFRDPREALAWRDAHPGTLACGERGGRPVPGFDLGNSPFEYAAERVRGRELAFASTNGSFALRHAAGARARVAGAFANASAVAALPAPGDDVTIVCAGKEGRFALEDAACAGWLVRRLVERGWRAGDAAARACAALAPEGAAEVRALVEGCDHARYLASLGEPFARDVAYCGTLDALDSAPVL